MIQHGQVFKLKTRGADGQPLWAYRYRLEGRSSERPQVGGFASRAEAEKVPEGHRYEATQALRQVLNRAVAWGLVDYNPAKLGVPNPQRRAQEKRPFESWQQVEAVAAQLGPV